MEEEAESKQSIRIIFFLHLPFPSYEVFRQLPLRTSILRGVLAADLIGTHTYSSARHLISSCCRHLGITQRVQRNSNICLQWGSRSVCVYISHVGLDTSVSPFPRFHVVHRPASELRGGPGIHRGDPRQARESPDYRGGRRAGPDQRNPPQTARLPGVSPRQSGHASPRGAGAGLLPSAEHPGGRRAAEKL